MRIGHGYDAHKLTLGRDLILGGVKIEYAKGLHGHSDADVLVHAIMDSLLGAAAMGDIGCLFPDTDLSYKNANSLELLKKVTDIICGEGYKIKNIDSTIVAQSPKLSPYISKMRKNIALVCEINVNQINIKATTEEGMGFSGRGEGIRAYAVCLLGKNFV